MALFSYPASIMQQEAKILTDSLLQYTPWGYIIGAYRDEQMIPKSMK